MVNGDCVSVWKPQAMLIMGCIIISVNVSNVDSGNWTVDLR